MIKYPASAKWISKPVNIATGRSRIFEIFRIFKIKYFWLNCSHQRLFIKNIKDWLQPVGGYLHITVKHNKDIFFQATEGIIISFCISSIDLILDDLYRRISVFYKIYRPVG